MIYLGKMNALICSSALLFIDTKKLQQQISKIVNLHGISLLLRYVD